MPNMSRKVSIDTTTYGAHEQRAISQQPPLSDRVFQGQSVSRWRQRLAHSRGVIVAPKIDALGLSAKPNVAAHNILAERKPT